MQETALPELLLSVVLELRFNHLCTRFVYDIRQIIQLKNPSMKVKDKAHSERKLNQCWNDETADCGIMKCLGQTKSNFLHFIEVLCPQNILHIATML